MSKVPQVRQILWILFLPFGKSYIDVFFFNASNNKKTLLHWMWYINRIVPIENKTFSIGKNLFKNFIFWPCHTAGGILVPWPGIESGHSAVKAWSPNHWTAREFPEIEMNLACWQREFPFGGISLLICVRLRVWLELWAEFTLALMDTNKTWSS